MNALEWIIGVFCLVGGVHRSALAQCLQRHSAFDKWCRRDLKEVKTGLCYLH